MKIRDLVICLFCLFGVVQAMCPSQCSCTVDIKIIDCQTKGMKGVPNFLNPSLQSLDMSDNSIQKLENGLDFYTELKSLNLSRNQFQSLGRNQFMNQVALIVLDISWNLVSKLREGAFNGLESLQKLDLSSNLIVILKKRVFTGLVNLRKLDLSNCKLSNIEPEAFKYLKKLELLDMRKNQLRIIDDWTEPLISLDNLDLSQNLLQQLSEDSLQLPNLLGLDISDNLLSEINTNVFSLSSSLSKLDVSYNNIESVPSTPSVSHLVISGTRIRKIYQTSFQGMESLQVLEANNMLELEVIQDFSLIDCLKLSKLSLSGNPKLQPLPSSLFKTTPSLSYLDLSYNSWHYLSPDVLTPHLQTLRVTGLPLSCNCSLLWLWELSHQTDIVHGATCGNNTSLRVIDVDKLACPQENTNLIIGITVAIIVFVVIAPVVTVISIVTCIKAKRKEKPRCDYLHYTSRQSPQLYSTYLKDDNSDQFLADSKMSQMHRGQFFHVPISPEESETTTKLPKSPHLYNRQFVTNSPQGHETTPKLPKSPQQYSGQFISSSPQSSDTATKLTKSPQMLRENLPNPIPYREHNVSPSQTSIPPSPIYYSVQDGCVTSEAGQCPACGQVGGQCPSHCPGNSTRQVVSNLECCVPRNKTSLSPCHSSRMETFSDGKKFEKHSLKKQKYPDVLPRRNQNQNYYV